MARTLLELIQDAVDEIGIPRPSSIIGNVDDTSRQLLRLAVREGKEFHRRAHPKGGWTKLHRQHTFTTEIGTPDYALPSDFEYFAQNTLWDGSAGWAIIGPISAAHQQALTYGVVGSGPRYKFFVRNGRFYLDPTPSGEVLIAYDYYSNYWCASSAGTDQVSWVADTDTYLLDEECFILGLIWRYLRAKKLDYEHEFLEYERECAQVLARDGGTRDLPLSRRLLCLDDGNVPESGFGDFVDDGDPVVLGSFSGGFSSGFS